MYSISKLAIITIIIELNFNVRSLCLKDEYIFNSDSKNISNTNENLDRRNYETSRSRSRKLLLFPEYRESIIKLIEFKLN